MESVTDRRKLVSFLYELMRDHVPAGVVEALVVSAQDVPVTMTNGFLAQYAQEVADRLETASPAAQAAAAERIGEIIDEIVEDKRNDGPDDNAGPAGPDRGGHPGAPDAGGDGDKAGRTDGDGEPPDGGAGVAARIGPADESDGAAGDELCTGHGRAGHPGQQTSVCAGTGHPDLCFAG